MPPDRTPKDGNATQRATRTSQAALVPWEFFFYNIIGDTTDPSQEERETMVDAALGHRHQAVFDTKERRFGNQAGLAYLRSFLSTIEDLKRANEKKENEIQQLAEEKEAMKAQLQSQEPRIQRLCVLEKHFYSDLLKIREKVLYDAGQLSMPHRPRLERNAAAHGGNVLADIVVLLQQTATQSLDVIDGCKYGFQQLYELPSTASQRIWEKRNDDRLMALFNLRANIHTCSPWKQKMGFFLFSCGIILEKWYSDESSWYEPETVTMVDQLLNLANGWDSLLS